MITKISTAAEIFTKALRHHLNLLETAKVSKGNYNGYFYLLIYSMSDTY